MRGQGLSCESLGSIILSVYITLVVLLDCQRRGENVRTSRGVFLLTIRPTFFKYFMLAGNSQACLDIGTWCHNQQLSSLATFARDMEVSK